MSNRRAQRFIIYLAALVTLAPLHGRGQDAFPIKPIRFLLAYPAGGTSDLLARTIAQEIAANWKQNVLVDNRPGADGVLAADAAAKASGDGYTILLMEPSFAIAPSLRASLPYDPIKSFTPVGLAAVVQNLIVAHPSVPVRTVSELIDHARANPGKLNYAGSGLGASVFGMEILKDRARADIVLVRYKGLPALLPDLIGGQVQLTLNPVPGLLSFVRSKQLRPIGVASTARSPALPDVGTVAEAGFPGFDVDTWYGVIGPAGIAAQRVGRLNAELERVMNLPKVKERLNGAGFEIRTMKPEAFGALIRQEIEKWGTVVKRSGIRVD